MTSAKVINAQHPKMQRQQSKLWKGDQTHFKKQGEWHDDELGDH